MNMSQQSWGTPPTAVQALADRAAIADLVNGYAHAIRLGDVDTVATLFTDDAWFEVLNATAGEARRSALHEGRAALHAYLAGSVRRGAIVPLIHNLLITVEGDTATAQCVMVGAALDGRPRFMGSYQDAFRRRERWQFVSRRYTITSWIE